jgi:hypothetical protein
MAQTYRFGRRIPLPSTVQIRHELRVMAAQDAAKQRAAAENKSEAIAVQGLDALKAEGDTAITARKPLDAKMKATN